MYSATVLYILSFICPAEQKVVVLDAVGEHVEHIPCSG